MKLREKNLKLLKKNYIYNDSMEHDSCGVGLVASTEGLKSRKVVEKGIEALKESSGSVSRVLNELIGGIQSGMGYLGASNLESLRKNARYIRVTQAGQKEASPHDVITVKTSNSDIQK